MAVGKRLEKVARVSLFVVNLLYVLISAALLAVGGWIFHDAQNYTGIMNNEASPYTVSLCMIVCGIVMIITAIIGLVSAVNKDSGGLITHISLLLIMVVGVMILLGIGYEFKDKGKESMAAKMKKTVAVGVTTDDSHTSLEEIQKDFECCGADSYLDWETSEWKKTFDYLVVPFACCKDGSSCARVDNFSVEKIYTKGCIGEVNHWSDDMFLLASTLGIVFIIILIIGLLFACFILHKSSEQ